jgi:phosphate transport system substrate-binding protein
MGGIVPVLNVASIAPGQLVLDGPTLARISLGNIKKWNDRAIAKLNPTVKLPSEAILVVHRSDGSGTTFNFINYLEKVSPEWKFNVGSSTSVEWPVGIGAKGNEGVSNNVGQTSGSIDYVEYAYADHCHDMDSHPQASWDAAAATEALKFFVWAYANGAKMAEELDYVPMPKNVIAEIEKVWAGEIKDASGKSLLTARH